MTAGTLDRIADGDAHALLEAGGDELLAAARARRSAARGTVVTYSPKVFIPLTHLCRDVCHYCTFAHAAAPRRAQLPERRRGARDRARGRRGGLPRGAVHARRQARAALPRRARGARRARARDRRSSTSWPMCRLVLDETGPPAARQPGRADRGRAAGAARGLGLAGDHAGDDVRAAVAARRAALRLARQAPGRAPGDDRGGRRGRACRSRAASSSASARRAPSASRPCWRCASCARAPRPPAGGHRPELPAPSPTRRWPGTPSRRSTTTCWTIAVARLLLPPAVTRAGAAEPARRATTCRALLEAGIDDWGGVSPVTPTTSTPRRPGRSSSASREATADARATSSSRACRCTRATSRDARSLVRAGGRDGRAPPRRRRRAGARGRLGRGPRHRAAAVDVAAARPRRVAAPVAAALDAAGRGEPLDEDAAVALLGARGASLRAAVARRPPTRLRREVNGDEVTYVVTRNVNYTNVCYFRCGFCAFSKGRLAENLRGAPYLVPLGRDRAPRARGLGPRRRRDLPAGRHPPGLHRRLLPRRRARGEGGRAGPARARLQRARGLAGRRDARHRPRRVPRRACATPAWPRCRAPRPRSSTTRCGRVLCPDKIGTAAVAARCTTRRTAWACARRPRSCTAPSRARAAGRATCWRCATSSGGRGGFTEFVPLPFVHMEAPIYVAGRARPGPTFREAILCTPWPASCCTRGSRTCRPRGSSSASTARARRSRAGCNDLGGTLMNESISRAAGAAHGQELTPERMDEAIRAVGPRAAPAHDAVRRRRRRDRQAAVVRRAAVHRAGQPARLGGGPHAARAPGAGLASAPGAMLDEWISTSIRARSCSPATASRRARGGSRRVAEDARAAAAELGGAVVVKAQVLTGGRGKAGGIKLVADAGRGEARGARHPRPRHQGPRRSPALDRARDPTSRASTTSRSRSTAAPRSRSSCSRRMGGMDIEAVAVEPPEPSRASTSTRSSASSPSSRAACCSPPACRPRSTARSRRSSTQAYRAFTELDRC